jgi:hypothetical protein
MRDRCAQRLRATGQGNDCLAPDPQRGGIGFIDSAAISGVDRSASR